MAVALLIALLLDNTMPGTWEERGLNHWNLLGGHRDMSAKAKLAYDLPFGFSEKVCLRSCSPGQTFYTSMNTDYLQLQTPSNAGCAFLKPCTVASACMHRMRLQTCALRWRGVSAHRVGVGCLCGLRHTVRRTHAGGVPHPGPVLETLQLCLD